MTIKDSGDRHEFETGAVRDRQPGKGRPSLVPLDVVALVSKVYEEGAAKYSARNWEKGIPESHFLDSAFRHLAKLQSGCVDEPHASQVIWNMLGYIWTQYRARRGILPLTLRDMPNADLSEEEMLFLDRFLGIDPSKFQESPAQPGEVKYFNPALKEEHDYLFSMMVPDEVVHETNQRRSNLSCPNCKQNRKLCTQCSGGSHCAFCGEDLD